MQFVLIDDIAAHNDILAEKLMQLCEKRGWAGQVALKTTIASDVLDYAAHCTEATVYFLDIRLNEREDTLSLYRAIQTGEQESYLIYVSAYPQYAMDCLHTHAFDFLLKPLSDKQLADCMEALMRAHERRDNDPRLQIRIGSRVLILRQQDIVYFTRDRMNVQATCQDGSRYTWRESFDHLLPRLQGESFIQCHRGYIVNIRYIREIRWEEDQLVLQTGRQVPISRRRAGALRAALKGKEGAYGL